MLQNSRGKLSGEISEGLYNELKIEQSDLKRFIKILSLFNH